MQPLPEGTLTSPKGFLAGAAYAGLKTASDGQRDVGLLFSETPCAVAGVFTQNKFRAAPVHWCQEVVQRSNAQALVVNSGNANAGTGEQGHRDAAQMAVLAAEHLGLDRHEVLVASTGVIGVTMPMEKIHQGITAAHPSKDGGHEFVQAMMTTDTFPKTIAYPGTPVGGTGRHRRRGQGRRDDPPQHGNAAGVRHHGPRGGAEFPAHGATRSGGPLI